MKDETEQATNEKGTAKALYERLRPEREGHLYRARECALVTIPTLMPPEGHTATTVYQTPFQSVGADGVKNLAAKLLMSQLPPSQPMFRYQIDDFTKEALEGDPEASAKIEEKLATVERAVKMKIDGMSMRASTFEAFKQLINAGSATMTLFNDKPRTYRLDSFVWRRSPTGQIIDCITVEKVSYQALDSKMKAALMETIEDGEDILEKEVEVYGHFYLEDNKKLRYYQEIEGVKVEGSDGSWDKEEAPLLALRWTSIDGEHYGRSHVEEYLGDLISLDGLMKAILDGSIAAARLLVLVNPNGTTRLKDVAGAENGAIRQGNAADVTMLQADKARDFATAERTIKTIMDRLHRAFLMTQSIQREAERVTAEEIRMMAGELEDTLGGVYSLMSQTFQMPLVKRKIAQMTKAGEIPDIPQDNVNLIVVTGIEALGRGHDLSKLKEFAATIAVFPKELIVQELDIGDFITRVGTSLGIDMDGLRKSNETKAQDQQKAQQAQVQSTMLNAAEKSAPNAVKAATENPDSGQQAAQLLQQGMTGNNGG